MRRMGWRLPSQQLKEPTTETRSALGAQTVKPTPSTPPGLRTCAPITSNTLRCSP